MPTIAPSLLWEKRVVSLLEDLGLDDVNGAKGEAFQLGDHQIDACGGFGNVLIVFECKLGQELKKRSVRSTISSMRGIRHMIKTGMKNDSVYKKYDVLQHVLLGKNYQFTPADKEYACDRPKIFLKEDDFVDYYRDLYKKIGEYAKFDLLSELDVRREDGFDNHIQTLALRTQYGSIELYQFMLNPKSLLEIATVARREKRGEHYYQRTMKPKKITEIAEFVNTGKILPNSIIIAFDKSVKDYIRYFPIGIPYNKKKGLEPDYPHFGKLSFPLQLKSCWVIDGQHRLYAFAKGVSKDVNVPVIAFNGLNNTKQAKMFLDINKNQTTVDSDLVWDLNGELTPDEPDGIISNIVKDLNELGPLQSKISMPSKGPNLGQKNRRKISSLCIVIKRLKFVEPTIYSKLKNPMYSSSIEQMRKNVVRELKRFYEQCQKVFPEDWDMGTQGWILDNSSGDVMTRVFEKIVAHSVKKNKSLDDKFYKKYLDALTGHFSTLIQDLDKMKKEKNRVTSEGGKDDYLRDLCLIIRSITNEKDFGGELKSASDIRFEKFEQSLKEMLNAGLGGDKSQPDWLKSYVSDSTYGSAKAKAKARQVDDSTQFYKYLTLGEAIKLLLTTEVFQVFREYFSEGSEFGFSGSSPDDVKKQIDTAFSLINKHRKQVAHPDGTKMKAGDQMLLDANFEKINQCVKKAIDQLGGEVDQPNTEEEEENEGE